MTTELLERELLERSASLPESPTLAAPVRGLLVAQAIEGASTEERCTQLNELARNLLHAEPLAAYQAFEAALACHLNAGIVETWAFCETLKFIGRARRRLPENYYIGLLRTAMTTYGQSLNEEIYYSRDWVTTDILTSRVLALPPLEMVECALRFHDRRPAKSVWCRVQVRLQECDLEAVIAALSTHVVTLPSLTNAAHSEQAAFLSRCLASLPPDRAAPLYVQLFLAVACLPESATRSSWSPDAFAAVIDHLPIEAFTPQEGMAVLEAGLEAVSVMARTHSLPARTDHLSKLFTTALTFGPSLNDITEPRLCTFFHTAVTRFRDFESAERLKMYDLLAHTVGRMRRRPGVPLRELLINAALKERTKADCVLSLLNLLDGIAPRHFTRSVRLAEEIEALAAPLRTEGAGLEAATHSPDGVYSHLIGSVFGLHRATGRLGVVRCERAFGLLARMTDARERIATLASIGRTLASTGDLSLPRRLRYLCQCQRLALVQPQSEAATLLIDRCALASLAESVYLSVSYRERAEDAPPMMAFAQETVALINDDRVKGEALRGLAKCLAQLPQDVSGPIFADSLKTVIMIADRTLRHSTRQFLYYYRPKPLQTIV